MSRCTFHILIYFVISLLRSFAEQWMRGHEMYLLNCYVSQANSESEHSMAAMFNNRGVHRVPNSQCPNRMHHDDVVTKNEGREKNRLVI